MIDPIIVERFKELPATYQEFVTGDFAVNASEIFGTGLHLSEEQRVVFENGILFLLMFIFTKDDLVNYMETNLSLSKEAVGPVISAIIQSLPDYAEPLSRELTVAIPKSLTQQLQADISATEHDLESLKGIRTMAHDMKEAKVHPITYPNSPEITHQSSQADILQTQTQTPEVNTGPRWDTQA
jgi:hypothetical protein